MPGFGAIAHGQFILRRGDAERSDHHRGQRIGELTFEHRSFARHHSVMFRHFIRQKGRKNIRQVNLLCALEVSARELEVLAHHAEFHPVRAQNVPDLPQHLFHPHIRPHVSRAVVAGKQKFQLLTGLPALACAQHPSRLRPLDRAADPSFQNKVHHAGVPRAGAGQGRYL